MSLDQREQRWVAPADCLTEAIGDKESWSTNETVLHWLVLWFRRVRTIDFCSAMAAQFSQVQNSIFLTAHVFTFLVPIAHQPAL
jgi:hypothetical protein